MWVEIMDSFLAVKWDGLQNDGSIFLKMTFR